MDSVEKGNHHPRIGLISSLGLVCRIWAHCLTQGHPHPISPTLFWMYHFGGSIKGGVPLESSVEIGCSLTNHPAIGVPTGYPHHKEPPFLCKISAPRCSQTLSELLRFFVDARAAPAVWISGLALDDDIPATPALPGDFRLPVSEVQHLTILWVG